MAYDDFLIHTCTIYRKVPDASGNVDAYGQPVYTESSFSSKCRFFRKKARGQSGILVVSDIDHFKVPVSISLPLEVNVNKNDKITTTAEGFAGTYTVDDLDTIYGHTSPHHKTADLVRVET